jgi:indole-3-glycerol phosphate synthase
MYSNAPNVTNGTVDTVRYRLEDFRRSSLERLSVRKERIPLDQLHAAAEARGATRPFAEALAHPGTSVIAEHKRRSPSAGVILKDDVDLADVVRAYERGGAAALSIITEEEHWGGSLDDVQAAQRASDLPILRKDFTLDTFQVVEAKAYGADAILLVVGLFEDDPEQLAELYSAAQELDLDAIVEVHDDDELELALELGAEIIGINNRNLEDLSVDLKRTHRLMADIPAGKTVVSESGIESLGDIEDLERIGVDAVLVGHQLLRRGDFETAVRELTRAEDPTQA